MIGGDDLSYVLCWGIIDYNLRHFYLLFDREVWDVSSAYFDLSLV